MNEFQAALDATKNEINKRQKELDSWDRLQEAFPTKIEISLLRFKVNQLRFAVKNSEPAESFNYQKRLNQALLTMRALKFISTESYQSRTKRLRNEIFDLKVAFNRINKMSKG